MEGKKKKLINILKDSPKTSILDLWKDLSIKRSGYFVNLLLSTVNSGILEVDTNGDVNEYKYLEAVVERLIDITLGNFEYDAEEVSLSFMKLKENLENKLNLVNSSKLEWVNYFQQLKNKFSTVSLILEYKVKETISRSQFDYLYFLISIVNYLPYVEQNLKVIPEIQNIRDELGTPIFNRVLEDYVKSLLCSNNYKESNNYKIIIDGFLKSDNFNLTFEQKQEVINFIDKLIESLKDARATKKTKRKIKTKLEKLRNVVNGDLVEVDISKETEHFARFLDKRGRLSNDESEWQPEVDGKGRVDCTDLFTFSIDTDGTSVLDDALSIEKLRNGLYRLGVHVFDIATLVKEGSILEFNALKEYLGCDSHRIFSKDLAISRSLKRGISRPTISCFMDIDESGSIINYQFLRTNINVNYTLTFSQADKILSNPNPTLKLEKDLANLRIVAATLNYNFRKRRAGNWNGLKNKLEDSKLLSDKYRFNFNASRSDDLSAQDIVAEIMTMANHCHARYFAENDLPTIYIVSKEPDIDSLARAIYNLNKLNEQRLITAEYKYESIKSLITSTTIPCCSTTNIGNYNMGLPYYTNYTSPLYRYLDLSLMLADHDLMFKEHISERKKRYYEDKFRAVTPAINQRRHPEEWAPTIDDLNSSNPRILTKKHK